jgi:hypothetical protein
VPVENDARGGHLERNLDPVLADVGAESQVGVLAQLRDDRLLGVGPETGRRAPFERAERFGARDAWCGILFLHALRYREFAHMR